MYTCYQLVMVLKKQAVDSGLACSNRLKEIRVQKGFSQSELAGRAGITRQAVSSIESNLYLPTTAVALRLASVLCCRVEDLFSLAESNDVIEGAFLGSPLEHGS